MHQVSSCPNCGGGNQYQSLKPVSAGGGYAPNFLPGLGSWYAAEKLHIVICRDCGLSRWFASDDARRKLQESPRWRRV